jgi:tRNA (guanine37-N1)-methyltransferase
LIFNFKVLRMRIDAITLFPEMFGVVRDSGITGRAHKQGLWSLRTWNPRDSAQDVHRTVDDRPYGGGPGMVMMVEPLLKSVETVRHDRAEQDALDQDAPVILLSPAGCNISRLKGRYFCVWSV